MEALLVEVITYAPSEFYHCTHCEVVWQSAGIGRKIHAEQRESALPEDLAQEYQALSTWAHSLDERFGSQVAVKVIDAASLEGFFQSLRYRAHRYPAFIVGGKDTATGPGYERVTALIESCLAKRGA